MVLDVRLRKRKRKRPNLARIRAVLWRRLLYPILNSDFTVSPIELCLTDLVFAALTLIDILPLNVLPDQEHAAATLGTSKVFRWLPGFSSSHATAPRIVVGSTALRAAE